MKKVGYLVIGLLAGSILSTTAGAVTAQVKSLVGVKVAAEYTVTMNGQQLADKAVIVNNKAMVPLRAVSETMGAGVKVQSEEKTIEVTTSNPEVPSAAPAETSNTEFSGQSKSALEITLKNIEQYQLPPLLEDRDRMKKAISEAQEKGYDAFVAEKQKQLQECEDLIKAAEEKKARVQEAIRLSVE